MAELTIEGRTIEIDDGFKALPRDQQEAIVGDIARKLGLGASTSAQRSEPKPKQEPKFKGGALGAAALGAQDTASFGFGDELGAALGASSEYLASKITGAPARSYSELLAAMRNQDERASEENPGSYLAGQVAGGVGQGVGLARAGLSLGANAARAGGSLGRVAGASAADGMAIGALQGAGSGEDTAERVSGAVNGGVLGGLLGGAAPYAVAGVSAAAQPIIAPITSRLRPQDAANRATAAMMRRSGQTTDDVVARLQAAQDDGQTMYMAADALGNAGQRQLSSVVRTPNEARQGVVEALQQRQAGQGERLSAYLAEGFDASDTAIQRTSALEAGRAADASRNYGAARSGAGAVDPSRAIQTADLFLQPGSTRVLAPQTNIADDSVEAAVRRARSYLTDGNSVLTDYNAAFRAKLEIDNMIDGAKPVVQRHLIPIRNALDDALSQASPDYAAARDTFRRQSGVIDAVETGRGAASQRTRSADNIRTFDNLNPDERGAFRAGYVDPYISRVESMSSSPTTNKARTLITPKTSEEFEAFAAPGRGQQMGRRIVREQQMFDTANAALGGSKTADNLADAAELGKFDPSIITTALSGRPIAAAVQAVSNLVAEARGMPPQVVQRIARTLMETRPDVLRQILGDAMSSQSANDGRRALANTILTALSATGAGRLAAP